MKRSSIKFGNLTAITVAAWVLVGACIEFYNVAWGTGKAVGEFSPKWLVLFAFFILLNAVLYAGVGLAAFQRERFLSLFQKAITFRNKLSFTRWLLVILFLSLPAWFLQRTMWGIVFDGVYFRLLLWALVVSLLSFFITRGNSLIDWNSFLVALIFASSAFTIAVSLQGVTDYPFSMGWSEGNRIWDYSMRFGRDRYGIADNQDIYVLLDSGRMLVGGLPFLIPNVTIETVRLWIGLTLILPYFLVGLAAYIVADKNIRIWFLLTLWVFLFLRQGPIHSPLVLTAALTVFLWRKPLWLAIPLIIYAGYFAQSSRFTWLFAPGLWIGMLELAGASTLNGKLDRTHWVRAIALGLSGAFGGFVLPKLLPLFLRIATAAPAAINAAEVTEQIANTGVTSDFVAYAVTDQPLLWYRLLPNSTYGTGILLGLVIAVLPVTIFLIWLSASKKWQLNIWQKLAIVGPLLAFLVVGLVASTKIGGGGDLHNMDMFLIGMAFTVFMAWVNGGRDVILKNEMPAWMRLALVAALVVPAITPLMQLRSYNFGDEIKTLLTLTDTKEDRKAFDMLPDTETVNTALEEIQEAVNEYQKTGDVLFIDQRQLLTFGYVKEAEFIPEYEKKVLMNEALSSNYDYYSSFYRDITNQRFSLIISEPLRTPIKDDTYEFGEENNAWVEWVSIPVLCYYQEIQTYKEVNVMLLVPKPVPDECSEYIPPRN
ncbi:MAG: hypothetical protein OHK003_05420 [Anaerolineales bacterium]